MYDRGKVLAGIAIFLALVLFPVWYGAAHGQKTVAVREELAPILVKLRAEKGPCVEAAETMVASHMDLLDRWRDEVVRQDDPFFKSRDGTRHEKSLTRTCLGCHGERAAFCDRCHDVVGVSPNCWDCHNEPRGI